MPFSTQDRGFTQCFTHEQIIICSKTHLDGLSHEQTIVFGQLFAGHVVGSRPMKRKGKMHLVIRTITLGTLW